MLAANPPVYFRRNLESLVTIARAHEVVPVLPTFAWSEKVSCDPSLTSPEIVGAVHRTVEGSRVQAGLFADFLLREGLVPTRE
jgi:hypothetical protein